MHIIKHILLIIAGAFSLIFTFSPQLALASCDMPATPKEAIQCGACGASGQPSCPSSAQTTKNLNDTVASVINILSIVVGIAAVLVIILAGFRYITSGGNDQAIVAARKTLIYAIIGLLIVALAQVIVQFVLKAATKK